MNYEEKAHEVLEAWHERFMASPMHRRIAAKINEDIEAGVETRIDDLDQSAANEHADAMMLSVLGQALGDYGLARIAITRIQRRLELLSNSIKEYPPSDDMAEYVANRIHTIQIEEISEAFVAANKDENEAF